MTELTQRIQRFAASTPNLHPSAYIAPGAALIGDVTLEAQSSVWFQTVLRADLNRIHIGPQSNIQDGAVVHLSDHFGTIVGQRVTVGHCAVLHACRIDDEVLVGMNAVVLDGCEIGARSIIGANALVTGGTKIPPGSLFLGSPGKVVRQLTLDEQANLASWAERYVILAEAYRAGIPSILLPPLPQLPTA
jgi:carbonic anhydrase/acetyltransferase-like protein (isoleucine patch superfamily)